MTKAAEFYQIHLDRVSRSFAFCIRQLPDPLREWVGLSYLLCRVVDTIEDAPWPTPEPQLKAFANFDLALEDEAEAAPLEGWQSVFPAAIAEGEELLLRDSPRLMRDYHRFPPRIHEIIRESVLSMSQGMQHFCRGRADGVLRLRTLGEVNQYCFFVAGVVGELLAKLLAHTEPRFHISPAVLLKAHHFGLFLQKVNLLKDQVGDERLGRHLIPSRDLVEHSAHENATRAFDFLLAVPSAQSEFRRFCAWSLFLGLESLNVARGSGPQQQVLKVPRPRAEELLVEVEENLNDDSALKALFHSLCLRLGWDASGEPVRRSGVLRTREVPEWLLKLYRGPLDAHRLEELGMAAGT